MFAKLKNASAQSWDRAGAITTIAATGLTVIMGLASPMASAALDPSYGTTLTGIQSDATSLLALVVPVVGVIVGMVIVMKLFKRFANKI